MNKFDARRSGRRSAERRFVSREDELKAYSSEESAEDYLCLSKQLEFSLFASFVTFYFSSFLKTCSSNPTDPIPITLPDGECLGYFLMEINFHRKYKFLFNRLR